MPRPAMASLVSTRMLIRIVRPLPAPLMDGFDVRGLSAGQVYDVQAPLGHYLVIADYAEPVRDQAPDYENRGKRR